MEIRTLAGGIAVFPRGRCARRRFGAARRNRRRHAEPGLAPGADGIGAKSVVARPAGAERAAIGPDANAISPTAASNGTARWAHPALTQARDYAGGRLSGSTSRPARSRSCTAPAAIFRSRVRTTSSSMPMGGIYFTDLGKRRPREMDIGTVYTPRRRFLDRRVAYPMVTPTGSACPPDADALRRRNRGGAALGVSDRGAGRSERSVAVPHGGHLVAGMGAISAFDSLAVQEDGRIASRPSLMAGITVISPDGRHIEHHPMPDPMTTTSASAAPT